MKKLSSLKLSSIVFGIFMLLPMFSILSRVIYIQSNPNAKDSYYGETINNSEIIYTNNVVINVKYTFVFNPSNWNDNYVTNYISCYDFNLEEYSDNTELNNIKSFENLITRFRLWQNDVNQNITFYYVSDDIQQQKTLTLKWSTNNVRNIRFSFISNETSTLDNNLTNFLYYYSYNDYSYLDNVFDYSLHTFLEDDNNYSINFFNFFGNTFLNQSGNNMLYLNFLNWYMNYGLLVSSGYILFFVLYFFINVIRKLVLSFTNKIEGGF